MPKPKPPRLGRPKSGRVPITANVAPAVRAALRARARELARTDGNKRPQLGAAIESFVTAPTETFACGCRGQCTCGSRAHL